jgi:hypothetical protein
MPITARKREPAVPLSGRWRFALDPDDTGEADGWYEPNASWPDARRVSVPHSWQEHDDLREYTGTAWYRRTFEFSGLDGDERGYVSFGAVDYEADVWVNGEYVGGYADGYLPFAVDATDALRAGENAVTLRVFDPEDVSEIPHGKQGDPWYTRVSGPWQRIDLITVPETHVERARVTPDLETDTAAFDVDAVGATDDVSVAVAVRRDGEVVGESAGRLSDGTATLSVEIPDADYWTPETPALYDFDVTLEADGAVLDTYTDYFGMRSVSYDDGELSLNGEPLAVRGALDQAFYPETYYRPRELETFEFEIRAAKELGFNVLRKHIKPAHPEFLELADRLGMLVWEEPANPSRYTPTSKRNFREHLRATIERDYNRPSVVAWSIYNEEWGIGHRDEERSLWDDVEKQDYLESLYYETTEWDPTRLVCDNSGWAHVATDINDYHEYFVAPDRLDAWRERLDGMLADPERNYGDARTDPEEAPLVVSEFGTWGLCDVSKITDRYGGDPHWFEHDFLDRMKRPSGVQTRFEEDHASDAFDSLSDLAAAWQRREFESLDPIIAEMRERDGVAGYVITELTDIEWEFNGILDYLREEKSFYDDFARLNAPVLLHVELDAHAVWSGDRVTADVVVVNDTAERVDTAVEWEGLDASGTVDVAVDAHDSLRIEDAIAAEAPRVGGLRSFELGASMAGAERGVTRSVYVAPRGDAEAAGEASVFAADDGLASNLAERGFDVAADPADADVAVVGDPDECDADAVLVVPDAAGDLAATDRFEYTELPKSESWNLCACFVYQTLHDELDAVPGWAFEDLYPYGYVSDVRGDDDVSVGYTEGWLENSGAIAMVRDDGGRRTGVCTLRVTDSYGAHPVATLTVERLLAELAASREPTSAKAD